jgi:hypothetical protein
VERELFRTGSRISLDENTVSSLVSFVQADPGKILSLSFPSNTFRRNTVKKTEKFAKSFYRREGFPCRESKHFNVTSSNQFPYPLETRLFLMKTVALIGHCFQQMLNLSFPSFSSFDFWICRGNACLTSFKSRTILHLLLLYKE